MFLCKAHWKLLAGPALVATILTMACGTPPATPTATPTTPAPTATLPPPTPPTQTPPLPTGSPLPPPTGDPAAGEKVFNAQGCNACHVAKGAGGQIGPKLDGLYGSTVKLDNGQQVVGDEAYIRESIVSPAAKVVSGYQPVMPNIFASLPAQDLQNLIAFVASLK